MQRTINSSATGLALALLLAVVAPAGGWAQAGGAGQGNGPSPEQVLKQMHMANLMMIQLGELAEQKGVNPLIRRMGDREARDHRFGDKRVTELAAEMGIQLPSELPSPGQGGGKGAQPQGAAGGQGQGGGGMQHGGPPKQMQQMMQMAQKLRQAPPEQFDAQYLQAMEKMHRQVIDQLEKARAGLEEDSRLDTLIGKVLPILGQHHDLAIALKDDVGVAADTPAQR